MSPPPHVILRQPPQIALGPGGAASASRPWQDGSRQRVWVATSPSVRAQAEKLVAPWREAGGDVSVVTDIPAEPTTARCETLRAAAAAFRPDLVLAVGGGSVLDVAKVVAALHDRPEPASAFYGINVLTSRRTPLLCVPTTAGTGSEVSPNALLFDEPSRSKKAIISPALVPDLAIVDAELMTSLPPALTATTGLDALAHCLEAYANRAAHPTVDLWALAGVELAGQHLRAAVRQGGNLAARHAMATASLYGGLCLGPVNTAAVHALAYPLSGELHLAHGLSIALLLPAVVAFNLPAMPARYAALARALGADPARTTDDDAVAAQLPGLITSLVRDCGVALGLERHGVTATMLPALADGALTVTRLLKNNPRTVTREDAIAIYQGALVPPAES
jgi:alcohol dehydrogenase class IV